MGSCPPKSLRSYNLGAVTIIQTALSLRLRHCVNDRTDFTQQHSSMLVSYFRAKVLLMTSCAIFSETSP